MVMVFYFFAGEASDACRLAFLF